jgi:hypothetical protein
MTAPETNGDRYEWRITYRRRFWKDQQTRRYEDEWWARRLLTKLLGRGRPDLEPLVKLRFERRRVGEWELVEGFPHIHGSKRASKREAVR